MNEDIDVGSSVSADPAYPITSPLNENTADQGTDTDLTALDQVPELTQTLGEFFADGSALELLRGDRLLLSGGDQPFAAKSLPHYGRVFAATKLSPEYQKMLRLPTAPATVLVEPEELFAALCRAAREQLGLEATPTALLAGWVMANHLSGALTVPLLNPHGPATGTLRLLQFLGAIVRRPLLLSDPRLRDLLALPPSLRPTLLLSHPAISLATTLWQAGGIPGFAFLRDAKLVKTEWTMVCGTLEPIPLPALSLPLSDLSPSLRPITESVLDALAEQFQPLLLSYRLGHWSTAMTTPVETTNLTGEVSVLATPILKAIAAAPNAKGFVLSAFEQMSERQRMKAADSPLAVLIEVLLSLVHENASTVYNHEITNRCNIVLEARHEPGKLTPKAIGALLRERLAIPRKRGNAGFQAVLDSSSCERIHRLAATLGVMFTKDDCRWCDDELNHEEE